MRYALVVFAVAVLCAPALAEEGDTLVMPALVGEALYPASRMLRKMGLETTFEQVFEVETKDSVEVREFTVIEQLPEPGAALESGQAAMLSYYCPGELMYWDDWVVPFLGDFDNEAGFYRVEKPPEPIRFVGAGYPPELKAFDFSGSARIDALVDFDGSVLASKVVESSGYEQADSAALDAALQASFAPASHYGEPKRVWFPLPFTWEYDEGPQLPESGSGTSEDGLPLEP